MKNIKRIAKEIIAKEDMKSNIIDFFRRNNNPTDADFHKFAEENEYDVHEAEAKAYELATLFVNFLVGGRAVEKGFTEEDADPEQLKMGIEVEYEHTPDKEVAKRIALDHLAEAPDNQIYYTELAAMEEKIGVED